MKKKLLHLCSLIIQSLDSSQKCWQDCKTQLVCFGLPRKIHSHPFTAVSRKPDQGISIFLCGRLAVAGVWLCTRCYVRSNEVILSDLILSYHIMSYHIISCHIIISYHVSHIISVISYHALCTVDHTVLIMPNLSTFVAIYIMPYHDKPPRYFW